MSDHTTTKYDKSHVTHWKVRIQDPRRRHAVATRRKVEKAIRAFFDAKNFEEVRTPLLVVSPGMEPHIRPLPLKNNLYLPTSPEFAMKKLLAGGLNKIYQICPAFRDEPHSTTHLREFTLLEWYETQIDDQGLQKTTEQLIEALAIQLFGKPEITFQGKKISVKTPWPRLRTRNLFLETVGIDLVKNHSVELLAQECRRLKIQTDASDTWDDLYFKIWLNLIEPKLPENQAVFVTRYPASQAALSRLDQDPDGSQWAKRFEVYIGGIELANAFEELTDPVEQRKRFVDDMDLREKTYGPSFPKSPIDEDFIAALEQGLPPCSGIAMGVDRLVMLFANESDIDYTFYIT